MTEHLFHQVSWHTEATARATQIVQAVRDMTKEEILASDIAKRLKKLADDQVIDVPQLRPSDIHGSRREEEREDSDDWGGRIMRTIAFIDVTIPFVGDADGFRVTPSRSPLGLRAEIGSDSLILSLYDDDQVQSGVDNFIARVDGALDVLRGEVEAWRPQFHHAAENAYQARRKEIDEQGKRDRELKFPIR